MRQIDRIRPGRAERDVDYVVMGRSINSAEVDVSAYLRSGPRPRAFIREAGEATRAIG